MKRFIYALQNENLGSTTVENIFINEMMFGAKGDYVKVYLYGLKDSQNPGQDDLSDSEIAEKIGVPTETIREAWRYWEHMHVVQINYDSNGNEQIYFYPLNALNYSNENEIHLNIGPDYSAVAVLTDKRNYDPFENLIDDIGKVVAIKGELTRGQIEQIRSWKNNYLFTGDLILYLFEYAIERVSSESTMGGLFRYASKVAESWAESGYRDRHDVLDNPDRHTISYNLGRKIKRLLGRDEGLMESERRLVEKWLNEYNMSEEMILEATGRANVPKFSYIDGILRKWNANGWTSLRDVKEEKKPRYNKGRSKQDGRKPDTDYIFSKLDPMYKTLLEGDS